ncbi:MAG TPA: hypothetical protein VFZ98_10275 [Vicinamibacterales bacterium]
MGAGKRIAVALAAAAWSALAAWLSCGAVAFDGATGPRIGVLPGGVAHVGAVIAVGAAVTAIAWRHPRRTAIAVSPLGLTLVPWLPFPVPSSFLLWTGAIASLPWIAAIIAVAAVVAPRRIRLLHGSPFAAGAFSFVVFATAAWLASPSLPMGDEPHYLVITQSLLYDHDLQIENNHERGDYRAYFSGDLLPHYVRRGRNGAIYSIHAPGLPAIVLPAFAVGGYRGVVVFLLIVSASASGLAWWLAWRFTGDPAAAWFGWAVVTFAAPLLLHTYTVFPDGPAAAIMLTGVWALLRTEWEGGEGTPWFLHGMALATLPWMHTRFVVLAATLGGLVLVRLAHVPNAMSKAVAFLSVPALSALGWLFFFVVVYGVPDPTAPYAGDTQNSFAFLANGLGGLLFDQGFGLLATAPVILVATAGFARTPRLALEWLVVSVPYVLAVATFPTWWGGTSGPARFLVPLLLPLSIPAACAWKTARSPGLRTVMITLLLVSAWLAFVMAGGAGGRLGYHARNDAGMTSAPWMQWANAVVDLPAATPAFVPAVTGPLVAARAEATRAGYVATLPWVVFGTAAMWLITWMINRRPRPVETGIATAALVFAGWAMIASATGWRLQNAAPVTVLAAQMSALRAAAVPHSIGIRLTGARRLDPVDVRAIDIEAPVRRVGRGGFRMLNRPLASFPLVPAGSYELSVKRHSGGEGWVMAGVGSDQFSIVMQPIAAFDAGVRIDLPVAVRTLSIRAEEAGRDQLEAIVLRPITLVGRSVSREVARRAVRYGESNAFFVDDGSYPEPGGFWVAGARETEVVVMPDRPAATVTLTIRNGATPNTVTVESSGRETTMTLASGEERTIDAAVPPSEGSSRFRIRSSSGFRPAQVDRSSRDTRLLGAFVRVEAGH